MLRALIILLLASAPALANGYEMPALPGYDKQAHFDKYGLGFLQFDTLAEGICPNYDESQKRCRPPFVSVPVPVYKEPFPKAEKLGDIHFKINFGKEYYLTDAPGSQRALLPEFPGVVTGMIPIPVYEVRYCLADQSESCEVPEESLEGTIPWYRTPHGWLTLPVVFSKGAIFYDWPKYFSGQVYAGFMGSEVASQAPQSAYPISNENSFRSLYPMPLCSYGYYDGWCVNSHSSRNQVVGSTWSADGKPYSLIGLQVYEGWMLVLVDEKDGFKTRMCTNNIVPLEGKLGWVRMFDNQDSTLLMGMSNIADCEEFRK